MPNTTMRANGDQIVQFVAAAPGWKLCRLIGDYEDFFEIDIIAWAMIENHEIVSGRLGGKIQPYPVTIHGMGYETNYVMKDPKGAYHASDDSFFATKEYALKEIKEHMFLS